jgi:hypothetical protein
MMTNGRKGIIHVRVLLLYPDCHPSPVHS